MTVFAVGILSAFKLPLKQYQHFNCLQTGIFHSICIQSKTVDPPGLTKLQYQLCSTFNVHKIPRGHNPFVFLNSILEKHGTQERSKMKSRNISELKTL
jgi:hypothetical protein